MNKLLVLNNANGEWNNYTSDMEIACVRSPYLIMMRTACRTGNGQQSTRMIAADKNTIPLSRFLIDSLSSRYFALEVLT